MLDNKPGTKAYRRADRWFALGFMLCGAAATFGAWREITRHDGSTLTMLPAALMPLVAALWSRHVARRKPPWMM